MRFRRIAFPVIAVLMGCLIWAHVAHAGTICVELPFDKFGRVPNPQNANLCQACATVNSFAYLWNSYPDIYGDSQLLRDPDGDGLELEELKEVRDELALGWTKDGKQRDGMRILVDGAYRTTKKSFWEAKVNWINDFAPGTTILDGMVETDDDVSKWVGGSVLEASAPTWAFLWKQIKDKEDVELTFTWGADGAHAVTLTGLCFNDTNGNGKWDPGEKRWLNYLDPNNVTGDKPTSQFVELRGGVLFTRLGNTSVRIKAAYSESPVPEPTTLALFGVGVTALVVIRRKRRRA